MFNFNYYAPTKVIFGKQTENQVGEQIKNFGGKKILIHYGGKSAIKSLIVLKSLLTLKIFLTLN